MNFSNVNEFLEVFGSSSTPARIGNALGVTPKTAIVLAKKHGHTPMRSAKQIPGLEHLPGLPSFAKTRTWAGGIIHLIDCNTAADSPGYRSLLIHQSSIYQEDDYEVDTD